jgi:hypothetical protein
MYAIPLECVAHWATPWNRWAPEVLDNINCPFCGRLATFTVTDHTIDQKRNTIAASANCPRCRKHVRVWEVDPAATGQQERKCAGLYVYPKPSLNRKPMDGIDKVPPEIGRAYVATVAAFNAGLWPATGACCRRVLEGVAKHRLGEDSRGRRLVQLLNDLKVKVDLAKPLTSLADALREGGNLGAHFDDLEREPDQAAAGQMLDFLDYLMDYLYVLPAKVESFRNMIGGQSEGAAATPAGRAQDSDPRVG